MRMQFILGLAAASLIASPGAATARGEAAGAAAATKAAAKEEKKVCKRLEASNTRFAEKVCLTKAEWQKIEAESR